jgi:hypothetical protein
MPKEMSESWQARNSFSSDVLVRISKSKNAQARYEVAFNIYTPVEVLISLANDSEADVHNMS